MVDPELLRSQRDTMVHRGPDDAGLHVDGEAGLGHRRLSVVDLSPSGHQPMPNEDQTVWITFNGEIYNYVELAAGLRQRGHVFRSTTDTEVILHLYEELGDRCVEELNGMFGFALWDSRRRRLLAARDRLGIKPLLYYSDRHQLICASEAKAILRDPTVPREADREGLAGLFFAGFPMEGRTAFAGIRQLPAGHTLVADEAGIRVRKYWDVEYAYDTARSLEDTTDQLRGLLDDAVAIHCRSDASLGCHLSGGLDSSTVTALAARHRQPMKAFSIRFAEGGYYDESAYARALADHAHADYTERVPDAQDFVEILPSLIWHMEMPLPNGGGFSYYTASRLAADNVKVCLTGHGGDEVFAGYPAQFQAAFGSTTMFGESELRSPLRPARPHPLQRLRRRVRRNGLNGIVGAIQGRLLSRPATLGDRWLALHCGMPPAADPLFDRSFGRSLGGYDPRVDYLAEFDRAPTHEPLDRCLFHDTRFYLPSLLYMEDRVSMSVSLESRVPLLDYRIVEFMATVPPSQKVAGMVPKGLLKRAAAPVLPPLVRNRTEKRGFVVPLRTWLDSELRNFSVGILEDPACLDRGIIDPDRIRDGSLSARDLWTAVNLELWYRIHIDRDQTWLDRASAPSTELARVSAG